MVELYSNKPMSIYVFFSFPSRGQIKMKIQKLKISEFPLMYR
uniref:Uncharacterized protein n=1 Tax=Rhizophora mucronata TaxID=61149 RepID=A0A2P2NCD6_RHIMU